MGERTPNLSRKNSMSIGLGIFIAILLGLAIIFITPAGPTLASATSKPPAPSAQTRARAAGPCGDKTKRYADCGNGTVTDTMTGLIWLKQATCLSATTWEEAKKAVAALKDGACMLTDGSSPGDWRLPTQMEWEEAMKSALALGCTGPTLTNDAGNACLTAGPSSFTGVEADYYWSSTPMGETGRVWFGDLDHGHLLNGNMTNSLRVWPVRGGQR